MCCEYVPCSQQLPLINDGEDIDKDISAICIVQLFAPRIPIVKSSVVRHTIIIISQVIHIPLCSNAGANMFQINPVASEETHYW